MREDGSNIVKVCRIDHVRNRENRGCLGHKGIVDQVGHKWKSLEEEDRGNEVIPNGEGNEWHCSRKCNHSTSCLR